MARATTNPLLAAALKYLALGYSVVPAGARSKQPIIPWRAYQDRLPSKAQVRRWFERWPDGNIAIVTGAVSGIVVLDVDPSHGGTESLTTIEGRYGALPATVEAATGGGGRHVYFAHPGGEVRNRAGLAPGLDLRGNGGMIIAPPSIHPTGNPYRWKVGHAPDEVPLALVPIWLLEPRFSGDERSGHSRDYWRGLVRDGVEAGRRNSSLASFIGHLLWQGVDPDVIMELMLAWNRVRCRPPLSDDEVIRTVRSIERTHERHTAGAKR